MLSAADFLPSYMTEFMNFVMMMFPNFGSGFTSRFSAEWRRDILSFLRRDRARPGHPRLKLVAPDPRVSLRSPGDDPSLREDYFGRFAPYFERRCLRFLTPWVSRTPRRI